jgi:acyl-coenzyme A thioesterase PaaI-like protein
MEFVRMTALVVGGSAGSARGGACMGIIDGLLSCAGSGTLARSDAATTNVKAHFLMRFQVLRSV